jgi:hypothetical protein
MAIKVLIKDSKGYPTAIITGAERCSTRIHTTQLRRMKRGPNGEIIVPADYWYAFISLNKERFGLEHTDDVEIDPASINYYGYTLGDRTVCRTRLTEKFVYDFFNHCASRIVRYEPNTDGGRNSFGMRLAEFESVIIDTDYGIDVGEDATAEECEAIRNECHPTSSAYKALTNHIEMLQKGTALDIDAIEKEVVEYEMALNKIFKECSEGIEEFKQTLPDVAFDCGFTIVHTKDAKMEKHYQTLKAKGRRNTLSVQVNFPDMYFTCSHSHAILDKIKELSKSPLLDTIYVRTILD